MPVRKVVLTLESRLAPGDVLVLTAALKALHKTAPGAFLTDYQDSHPAFFDNNPYITKLEPWESEHVPVGYSNAICNSGKPYHFISGYTDGLARALGVYIDMPEFKPDLYLTEDEKKPFPGLPKRYIVVNSGHKRDFTAKHYSEYRYQRIVDALKKDFQFVQVGSSGDIHKPLEGAIDLVGKTSIRGLGQVINHADLVLTPVSLPMHMAAALPLEDGGYRPCVVLAGQREQEHWERYPGHTMLGTVGKKLGCGVTNGRACWLNKAYRADASGKACSCPSREYCKCDNSICKDARDDGFGQVLPACLERISVQDVITAIERYF